MKPTKIYIKRNTINKGIAESWMQAVEIIKTKTNADIIIKADNDAIFMTQNWLRDMVSLFKRNTKIILSPYVEGLDANPGGVLRQRMSNEMPYVLINDKVLGIVPYLGGIVWATPAELYNGFKFPDNLPGNKDYFISQYARRMGYSLFYMEEARVYHLGGNKGQVVDYK